MVRLKNKKNKDLAKLYTKDLYRNTRKMAQDKLKNQWNPGYKIQRASTKEYYADLKANKLREKGLTEKASKYDEKAAKYNERVNKLNEKALSKPKYVASTERIAKGQKEVNNVLSNLEKRGFKVKPIYYSTTKASSLLNPFYSKSAGYYKYKVKAPESNN